MLCWFAGQSREPYRVSGTHWMPMTPPNEYTLPGGMAAAAEAC